MRQTRTRGYLAALAVVAVIVLVGGYSLRPKSTPVTTISEAERVQLQDVAQRQSLQRRSQMFAGYARDLSPMAVEAVRDPASMHHRDPRPGEVLIVVVPANATDPRWITTEFAGAEESTCSGIEIPILTVDSALPKSFETGAVFTLNEDLVGLVSSCDDRLVIVPPDAFIALQTLASEQQTMMCCGIRFAPAADGQAGRLVSELRVASILDRAGVEPGDQITSINGNAISSDESLRLLLQASLLKIDVVRGGRMEALQYQAPSAGSGAELERSPAGTRVRAVAAGTAAEKVGFKPGDVVIRAAESKNPPPAAVDKLLASPADAKFVVLRGDRRILLQAAR